VGGCVFLFSISFSSVPTPGINNEHSLTTSAISIQSTVDISTISQRDKIKSAPPFSVALAVAYMFKVYNQSKSYSSLVLIHSALKWYHSFLPFFHQNPFDSKILSNFLESAKRCKPTINRKVPISTDMIKAIDDKYLYPPPV
jgi:hypothetical protein